MTTSHFQVSPHIEESHNAITLDNVRIALFDRFEPISNTNPLEHLAFIDQIVFNPTFPRSSYSRRFALTEVLNSLIATELMKHRQILELPYMSTDLSISDVFAAIIQDSQTSNSKLIGWSWLYYRYVRIDLGIQQNQFCEIASLNVRTLRRYQDNTIRCIVDILIDKEWKVRQQRLVIKLNKNYAKLKYLRHSQSS